MSTIKTTNITHGSNSGTNNLILDNTGKVSIAQNKLSCPGTIIQVAQVIKTDTWSESVAEGAFSAVVTGLTQAFTCSSTSNKVLITGNVYCHNGASGGWSAGLILTADGNTITAATGDQRGSNRVRLHSIAETYWTTNMIPINYLYSPNSTSSITYGVKIWNSNDSSARTMAVNYAESVDSDTNNYFNTASTLTFMEIAG